MGKTTKKEMHLLGQLQKEKVNNLLTCSNSLCGCFRFLRKIIKIFIPFSIDSHKGSLIFSFIYLAPVFVSFILPNGTYIVCIHFQKYLNLNRLYQFSSLGTQTPLRKPPSGYSVHKCQFGYVKQKSNIIIIIPLIRWT